jgi:predicted ATP-dependent endonuclease of OLD family
MYFGDYEVLPSKMNLNHLKKRTSDEATKNDLSPEERGILALLRMANIEIEAFANPGQLESLISRIEGVSISLTDQIMEFWKQNENLAVKIDIRSDPADEAPFNDGPNLYIRIANNKHRGVTTPFKQRSRGFIWFFSFLVWFDSVQQHLADAKDQQRDLILLLDEPGLSLHALAQQDFLKYIDDLALRHQVIYSTHSPFMIHSDRLLDVRVVEDRDKIGTVITDNVSWTDERTIFPLQAAVGWTIAQNLFISERNLLVEGTSELIYLQVASALIEARGGVGLDAKITIVPTGGLDKVVTFVALLGANQLKIAVLHDYSGAPDQKLVAVMREKMIAKANVMDASQFRDLNKLGISSIPTDVEDWFDAPTYLEYLNRAFGKRIGGKAVTEANLPPGDRIVDRLGRYLEANDIKLKSKGGYNHYTVAAEVAKDPSLLKKETLDRFEELFKAVNPLLQ